ncbi:MAG: cyclic pyranopterin monophosphate synthase MoaC [Verrucomicrobiaceae bacterium]|nr:cyclic pyranopterin monophosphate synthase MoaC [Verrucomicrobiaceae bacterium]
MSELSHLDEAGQPRMVDVGSKAVTSRIARAACVVILGSELMGRLQEEGFQTRKGSVLNTAILAGIMAAKQTASLIPLCHPLPLDKCDVKIEPENDSSLRVLCECSTSSRTGVEMEALTGASVAALTIYDMCKASNPSIEITRLHLVEKRGGKSDFNAV